MKIQMFKILVVALTLCFLAAPVFGEDAGKDACFTWTKNANVGDTNDNNTEGYRIYRDPSTDVQFVFPDLPEDTVCNDPDNATKCTKCVPRIDDNKNHRYAATAYNGDQESDFSAYADDIIVVKKSAIPVVPQGPASPQEYLYFAVPVKTVTQ